jgi:uncharacterized protein
MNIILGERTKETVRIYFEKANRQEIKAVLPQKAKTVEEALADFEKTLQPNATSYGRTIYVDGEYVGDIWCYCIDRNEDPNAMLSYCVFEPEYWSKGIASKAVALFLEEIRGRYALKSIGAFTYAGNIASIKVLEKNGFHMEEEFEEDGRASKYFKYDELISRAIAFVQTLFAGNADGHDFDHTMRVYRNAMKLIRSIACDKELVALAALLHDADDYKLFATANNANARRFLQDSGVKEDRIDKIIDAINAVSFSKNKGKRPDTIEGQIVQDADRLDAIGAIGVARTFAYGGKHGRGLEDSIQHFYDKLLLLKDTMNTEAARKLAEERHTFMRSFLDEWKQETKE